jgi:hypothetical protein
LENAHSDCSGEQDALFMPSLCFGLHSDIKPSIGEPFSAMRDTVYPGTDLAILKMDPLKKEGFPGEGIAINMIIMNYGFSESASTKIDFWVSDYRGNQAQSQEWFRSHSRQQHDVYGCQDWKCR